jgi:negative regulator of sigma E activity
MISRLPDRSAFIFLGLFVCSTAMAADAAHEWLMKINHAARALDYEGIFVYHMTTTRRCRTPQVH